MRRLRSFDLDLNQFPNKDLIVKFTFDLELRTGLKSISQICKHTNTNSEMVPHCPQKGSRLRDLRGTMFRYGSISFIRAGKEDRTVT